MVLKRIKRIKILPHIHSGFLIWLDSEYNVRFESQSVSRGDIIECLCYVENIINKKR